MPALGAGEIHLWWAELSQPVKRLAKLAATLTADERERAARFRFPAHQNRFIAGRGLLRELLGTYLDRPPAMLRFTQGPQGKPALAGQEAEATLYFNLSHSGDRALYAVAGREVGVDLEAMDRRLDYAAIAERICTPCEWAVFQTFSAERIHEQFLACWTRKEAVAKALGGGLASGLSTLDVCFRDSGLSDGRVGFASAGREWSVLNVPLESGWIGALAAVGVNWNWRIWRWENAPCLQDADDTLPQTF